MRPNDTIVTISKDMFSGVPDSSPNPLAQWAQDYLTKGMGTREYLGMTIRITKKQGRYYVSEWRAGEETFGRNREEIPIARVSRIRGKKGQWQLVRMMRDLRWHNLVEGYRGHVPILFEAHYRAPGLLFLGIGR